MRYLIMLLFFSYATFAQDNRISQIFDKLLYANKFDTLIFQELKSDTNFIYKHLHSAGKDSTKVTFDFYYFKTKIIPKGEYADSIQIDFTGLYIGKGDYEPGPSISFFFSSDKTKYAKQKFKDIDNKLSKIARKRIKTLDKDFENDIKYILPTTSDDKYTEISLSTFKETKDNKPNSGIMVYFSYFN